RVVSRLDRHREDGAGPGIEDDRGRVLRVPLADGLAQDFLGVRLDRVIERQRHVLARYSRPVAGYVDDATRRILDDRLVPGLAGEVLVEPELDSGEPLVVDADVAEHLSADRMLRIRTPFLGKE